MDISSIGPIWIFQEEKYLQVRASAGNRGLSASMQSFSTHHNKQAAAYSLCVLSVAVCYVCSRVDWHCVECCVKLRKIKFFREEPSLIPHFANLVMVEFSHQWQN